MVRRLPPTPAAHFWSQRVHQAYDDLAQPGRLLAEPWVLPAVAVAARRGCRPLVLGAATTVMVAEVGRRRLGRGRVPAHVCLAAHVWLLERGVGVRVAVGARTRGGVRYHGLRLVTAAHSLRHLRAEVAACVTVQPDSVPAREPRRPPQRGYRDT